jgi:hypothetical protein
VSLVSPLDPLGLFFAFAIFHALADFPLQGDYLACKKVRSEASGVSEWLMALGAHSLIHAGAVWLLTGSKALGLCEFFLHALIDLGKGEKRYGLIVDQGLHLACKAGYVAFLYASL